MYKMRYQIIPIDLTKFILLLELFSTQIAILVYELWSMKKSSSSHLGQIFHDKLINNCHLPNHFHDYVCNIRLHPLWV